MYKTKLIVYSFCHFINTRHCKYCISLLYACLFTQICNLQTVSSLVHDLHEGNCIIVMLLVAYV